MNLRYTVSITQFSLEICFFAVTGGGISVGWDCALARNFDATLNA